jgi:squalene-hopene/tetraprenyl-beta-curcumene cyclase
MKPYRLLAVMLTAVLFCGAIHAAEVLVEAEGFAERGEKLDDVPPEPIAAPPATMKAAPAAANGAVEPIRKQFSAAKAAEFLDANAHAFEKQCFACHSTYAYLMARPKLAPPSPVHLEARLALEQSIEKLPAGGKRVDPLRVSGTIMTAATLALHDSSTTGTLHPQTRKALDRMWDLQREDGGWEWIKLKEPPSAIDDHFGVTMAAFATGIAPENYASTPKASQRLEKIRAYLRSHPPVTTHQRAMLLLASTGVSGLTTGEQRAQTTAELFALQRPDGGWAMASLADDTWKRKDGTPQQPDVSDGYGTGFVLYVLRTAAIPAADPRLQQAVAWLKTHQRESGGWFTRAPRNRDELSSYAGTVYAILALATCKEL